MLLAVSSDGPEDLQLMVDRVAEENDGYALDYPLLSDPGAAIIKRYGIFNVEAASSGDREIPHPSTYVIDMDGRVQWKFIEVDYRVRPENEDIVAALAALE